MSGRKSQTSGAKWHWLVFLLVGLCWLHVHASVIAVGVHHLQGEGASTTYNNTHTNSGTLYGQQGAPREIDIRTGASAIKDTVQSVCAAGDAQCYGFVLNQFQMRDTAVRNTQAQAINQGVIEDMVGAVRPGAVGRMPKAGAGGGASVAGEVTPPVTSGGTANAATVPGLKNQLATENLANIAAQDPRLAAAVNGSGVSNPNFPVGSGTAAEANSLGKIWVGDGARPLNNVPGGLISADGTRVYRPPTVKSNTPGQFNPTGVQANFQMRDPSTGVTTSNGHMVIK